MTIRKAEKYDLASIAEIECTSFENPWSSSAIEEEFSLERSFMLVADADNCIAGYASYRVDDEQCELFKVAVKPEYRGTGIACLLLVEGEKKCISLGKKLILLEVDEINRNALRLYAKLGFTEYHRRKQYYGIRSAILMKKEIDHAD